MENVYLHIIISFKEWNKSIFQRLRNFIKCLSHLIAFRHTFKSWKKSIHQFATWIRSIMPLKKQKGLMKRCQRSSSTQLSTILRRWKSLSKTANWRSFCGYSQSILNLKVSALKNLYEIIYPLGWRPLQLNSKILPREICSFYPI